MSSAAANVATTSSLPPTILVGADYYDTTTTTTSRGNMTTTAAAGATLSSSSAITTTTAATTKTTTHQLQQRLSSLKARSTDLSSELTRRLATSRSGQSLLHIGPSLSTLPPDLSSLADAITPFLDDVANYEARNVEECERLTAQYRTIDTLLIRTKYARECSTLYDELIVAERIVIADVEQRMKEVTLHAAAAAGGGGGGGSKTGKKKKDEKKVEEDDSDDEDEDDDNDGLDEDLDHASSLERVAYITLHLLKELQVSTAAMSAIAMNTGVAVIPPTHKKDDSGMNMLSTNNSDGGGIDNIDASLDNNEGSNSNNNNSNVVMMEKSRFLVKLAPRIRRLESDAARCLISRLEGLLINVRCLIEGNSNENNTKQQQQQHHHHHEGNNTNNVEGVGNSRHFQVLLITIGHVLRSLALLHKGQDAEATFARVAIMPIVRGRLNVGKLDMGGSRGECAGLFSLLDDIANTIKEMYGPILRLSEGMFASIDRGGIGAEDEKDEDDHRHPLMEIDLITCGVWIPVATALMADPGLKMALFSPGMANVLQANYNALDTFLSELASVLLSESSSTTMGSGESSKLLLGGGDYSCLYYTPVLTAKSIECAQSRLYAHPSTVDYYRRWNLPIYYQLRFAEFTRRMDDAIRRVREGGWHTNVYTGNESDATKIHDTLGFELPIFVELYDILSSMWKLNVFLRPLTHRFLRGAVQLVGRMVAFIRGGLEGEIEFGRSPIQGTAAVSESSEVKDGHVDEREIIVTPTLPSYFWNERVEDVAAVSWELTILATTLSHDYLEVITNTVCPQDDKSRHCTYNTTPELDELKLLASDIILESSRGIAPLVLHSWNVLIVDKLTSQCCAPLSSVKGVAATYRMTNRPPPTQASPFVSTILRPLAEFDKTYMSRTPPEIGNEWKCTIISSVSDKYSLAVEELIATVKRTEEALKGRATRRTMAGGMSDGEKVKLQLFLDHRDYRKHVANLLGGDSELTWIEGLVKLGELTKDAEELFLRTTEKK